MVQWYSGDIRTFVFPYCHILPPCAENIYRLRMCTQEGSSTCKAHPDRAAVANVDPGNTVEKVHFLNHTLKYVVCVQLKPVNCIIRINRYNT